MYLINFLIAVNSTLLIAQEGEPDVIDAFFSMTYACVLFASNPSCEKIAASSGFEFRSK